MTISFLKLPVEVQVEVVNNISLYSDLKALCLVSKELFDLATPRIYHKVDLKIESIRNQPAFSDEEEDRRMLSRIHSLLLRPANLWFVKVFKTGWIGRESTTLMDELLPLLPKDSLLKFSYSTDSDSRFPTPQQIEFLWGRQRRLKNLKLCSHMVSGLEKFLQKRTPSENALLKSFTKLSIGNFKDDFSTTPDELCWPLKNLDLCLLQNLSLNGFGDCRHGFPAVMDLFAGQTFVNLAKLIFEGVNFGKTVTFTNVPKLKSLVIVDCENDLADANGDYGVALPFEFPDNLELQSLEYWDHGEAEPLTHLVAQVRGLKKLVIGVLGPVRIDDQGKTDLSNAVRLHTDTLRRFEIIGPIQGITTLSQIFPIFNLGNLPNFPSGALSDSSQSYSIIRLSASVGAK